MIGYGAPLRQPLVIMTVLPSFLPSSTLPYAFSYHYCFFFFFYRFLKFIFRTYRCSLIYFSLCSCLLLCPNLSIQSMPSSLVLLWTPPSSCRSSHHHHHHHHHLLSSSHPCHVWSAHSTCSLDLFQFILSWVSRISLCSVEFPSFSVCASPFDSICGSLRAASLSFLFFFLCLEWVPSLAVNVRHSSIWNLTAPPNFLAFFLEFAAFSYKLWDEKKEGEEERLCETAKPCWLLIDADAITEGVREQVKWRGCREIEESLGLSSVCVECREECAIQFRLLNLLPILHVNVWICHFSNDFHTFLRWLHQIPHNLAKFWKSIPCLAICAALLMSFPLFCVYEQSSPLLSWFYGFFFYSSSSASFL